MLYFSHDMDWQTAHTTFMWYVRWETAQCPVAHKLPPAPVLRAEKPVFMRVVFEQMSTPRHAFFAYY